MGIFGALLKGFQASIRERNERRELEHRQMLRWHAHRRPRRKPPEADLPVPAIPPRGPLPKQGGAAAPLQFSDQRPSSDLTQAARSTSSPSLDRRAST